MTGVVVSLNQERKKRRKAEETATAAANRARYGRSKAEKLLEAARGAQDAARLEGHRLPKGGAES